MTAAAAIASHSAAMKPLRNPRTYASCSGCGEFTGVASGGGALAVTRQPLNVPTRVEAHPSWTHSSDSQYATISKTPQPFGAYTYDFGGFLGPKQGFRCHALFTVRSVLE